MPRLSAPAKLEKAIRIRDQAEAVIRQTTAKLRAQERKDDTRRKIILGSLVMEVMARDPKARAFFAAKIAKLPREQDRAVFDGWEPPAPPDPKPPT